MESLELDKSLELVRRDILNEKEICILFERLDQCERYGDMWSLFCYYPRTISIHYDKIKDKSKIRSVNFRSMINDEYTLDMFEEDLLLYQQKGYSFARDLQVLFENSVANNVKK